MPSKPREVYLACELMREFMLHYHFDNTVAVFMDESGQPGQMLVDRELIGGELGLNTAETPEEIPLILLLIRQLMKFKCDSLFSESES
jgi:hypothetical protein